MPPQELIEKYRGLKSPYYTLDYAELEDDLWKILEAGDGQVSGLSDFQDYYSYFRTLYHCFNLEQESFIMNYNDCDYMPKAI